MTPTTTHLTVQSTVSLMIRTQVDITPVIHSLEASFVVKVRKVNVAVGVVTFELSFKLLILLSARDER